jgi:chromosome partitioning protein
MRSIAFLNQKGGVGKTTTVVNLGACLAEAGRRVLLVDMDPQANLTSWLLGPASEELEETVGEILLGKADIPGVLTSVETANLNLLPSGIHLSGVERILAGEMAAEGILKRNFEKAGFEGEVGDPEFDEYDYVLFDCPPSLGLLTLNALTAAQEVIIPVQTKVLALNGVANLRRVIGVVRDRLNPALEVTGILLCMTDSRTNLSREVEASARKHFGPLVFKSMIRENVRVAESPSHFLPITRYASTNPAAEDYRNFCREVLAQEKPLPPPEASAKEENATEGAQPLPDASSLRTELQETA